MKKARFQARHILKFFSLGLLLVVLLLIALNFMTRSQRQMRISEASSAIEEPKIDKKEEVEFREVRKDKESTRMTADRHYIGEDGLYHLEGNVRLSFSDRIEGGDIHLRGEEIIHDREWSYFWLRGESVVELKDLIVKSTVLEFDRKENVFSSDQEVQFFSGTISGSAQKCAYDLDQKKVQLSGKVHLELQPNQEDPLPLKMDTEFFEYFVGKGIGNADKGVELVHGKSHATAGLLRFELAANREQVKSMLLKEGVKIILIEEFEKEEPLAPQTAFSLYGDRCELEADEIFIRGFVDMPRVQSLEARGRCSFRFLSNAGSSTQIEGKKISFDLSQYGRLKKLSVLEDARITEKDKGRESEKYIEGHVLSIEKDKDILKVDGTETARARIHSPSSEITARQITIFLKNNDLETKKETEVVIYPEEASPKRLGFFSEGSPVFITTENLRYFEDRQRFLFSGGAKLWQVKEMFLAQEVSMDIESGAVRAQGRVQSIFPYKPKEKDEEERIKIESGQMAFDPEKNLIHYAGGVTLQVKDLILNCRFLTISMDRESGGVVDMMAKEKVSVFQKTYEGRGEDARYDVEKEIITVLGNPVLIDKERGKTEGGKLTFYMADDRIVIENKDRERSITVIK